MSQLGGGALLGCSPVTGGDVLSCARMATSRKGSPDSSPRGAHPSDSSVQRDAEIAILRTLSTELGVALAPCRLELAAGVHVHVDGFHAGPPAMLAEVFAHHGALRPGQRHKLMSDALKLVTVSKVLFGARARVVLVLADDTAAAGVRSGWRNAALGALGVEVKLVALPPDVAAKVRAAQATQSMVNRAPPQD